MEVEQQDDRHAYPELSNPRPEQRPITTETTVDTSLIGTRFMRTNAISPASLLDESVALHQNINRSHLNLQILRIVTPKNGCNTANTKY